MHEKHTDQLPIPQARWSQCYKRMKKHEDKDHGKTLKHEAPHGTNRTE